ncbi:DUF2878 domain-containing protein, partial [uncultured Caballeronia sp.]|uniref:DUF2878 domain-containing protein n=1 Tax=uncultured Caballeronia sp. TaxID=1827198 RepID=UPI0035CC62D7
QITASRMPDASSNIPDGPARSSAFERWASTVYFIVGQFGWFACVLSAAHDVPWIGVAVTLVLVAVHLARVDRRVPELKLLASVIAIGAVWESVPVAAGLLVYPNGTVLPGAAPYWILALWALFAAQFNTTFGWLKSRMLLASVLGAVAGPLSFRGGAALGAVRFAQPLAATLTLAAGWAVLLPVLILLSRRWDGVHTNA